MGNPKKQLIDNSMLYNILSEKYRLLSDQRRNYLESIDNQIIDSICSEYRGKVDNLSILDIGEMGFEYQILSTLSSDFNIEATL